MYVKSMKNAENIAAVCMYAVQASIMNGSAFLNWIPLPHTQRFQPKDKDLEVPHYVVNHRFFNKNLKTFKLHAAQMPQTTEIVRKSHINMCRFPENQLQSKGSHVRLGMIFMFADILVACVLKRNAIMVFSQLCLIFFFKGKDLKMMP